MKSTLIESSFNYGISAGPSVVAFYGSRITGNKIPGVILLSEDGHTSVEYSEDFRLIITKPRTLMKNLSQVNRGTKFASNDWFEGIVTLTNISRISSYMLNADDEVYNNIMSLYRRIHKGSEYKSHEMDGQRFVISLYDLKYGHGQRYMVFLFRKPPHN